MASSTRSGKDARERNTVVIVGAVVMLVLAVSIGRQAEARMNQQAIPGMVREEIAGQDLMLYKLGAQGVDMPYYGRQMRGNSIGYSHMGGGNLHEGFMILTWLALMAFLVSGTMFFLKAKHWEHKK